MKFLLNVNVLRELGQRLIANGHQCRHAGDGDIRMGRARDAAIIEAARRGGEVIIHT